MRMCVSVCVHVWVCVNLYVCICASVCVCMHMCEFVCEFMCVCTHVCVCVWFYLSVYAGKKKHSNVFCFFLNSLQPLECSLVVAGR